MNEEDHVNRLVDQWNDLVAKCTLHAAGGLLVDLFHRISFYRGLAEMGDESEQLFSEAVMQILEDADGTKFVEWMTLYKKKRSYTPKGRRDSFEAQAHIWAVKCWRRFEEQKLLRL